MPPTLLKITDLHALSIKSSPMEKAGLLLEQLSLYGNPTTPTRQSGT